MNQLKLPFTILIDTAEQHCWTFEGMIGDAKDKYRPLEVRTKYQSLGRHPNSNGDYSIEGHEQWVSIERKSREDITNTVLGWPTESETESGLEGHRARFEQELERLERIGRFACVVVESSMAECIKLMTSYGVKPAEVNAKIFFRSVVSYQQRFPHVQWMFLDSRRLAEMYALAWFRRYWRMVQKLHKMTESFKL